MSDIFVSYASQDRARVQPLVHALEQRGWLVWWDRTIAAGQRWDHVIEAALKEARCVIVVWTRISVESEWVVNEAAEARRRGVLIPVLLDDVEMPLEFKRLQTANLIAWSGDASGPGFNELAHAVAKFVAKDPTRVHSEATKPAVRARTSWLAPLRANRKRALLFGALVLAGIAGYSIFYGSHSGLLRSLTGTTDVRVVSRTEAQSADTPFPVELRIPVKVTLDQNESAYFCVALPAEEIRVVLDMKTAAYANLQSSLSILDRDGAVFQTNAIYFNETDISYRKVAYFTLKKPATMGFKVTNFNGKGDFWLTVSRKSNLSFVHLYGGGVPTRIALGEGKTGPLSERQDAYYVIALPKGEYKAIAELTNAQKQRYNIQGYFALLDQDGGNQQELIRFNEIDVSSRKAAGLTVKNDATFIFRFQNSGSADMNHLVRISRAEP
jgi:hypothetical protein